MFVVRSKPLPRPEMFDKGMIIPPSDMVFEIPTYTRADKIKRMIHRCVEWGIEIPGEWVEEYNNQCKTEGKKCNV